MPLLKSLPAILLLCLAATGCAGPGAVADTADQTPYLRDGVVGIKPGESYAITGRIEAGKLVDLRYSDLAPKSGISSDLSSGVPSLKAENVLSFKLEMTIIGMTLMVQNSFPETVKLRAAMQLVKGAEVYKTSACPISPAGTSFEFWPQPITLLLLTDFRVLPPGSRKVCE